MTHRSAAAGSITSIARSRQRRRRRSGVAVLLALFLGAASLSVASPAYAAGERVIRGTVPVADGVDAVVSATCYDESAETQSTPAATDGTWELRFTVPAGSYCTYEVVAHPFDGNYRFTTSVILDEVDRVINVEYPPVETVTVVTAPAAAGPVGTAYTSSDGEFTFADGTEGQLSTSLEWDPNGGVVSYARARVNEFQYEVVLANGYRLQDQRYLSYEDGQLTVNVPRTRTLTASGNVVNATPESEGNVTLRCGEDDASAQMLSTYTVSLLTIEDSQCLLEAQSPDTTGDRSIVFIDGAAHADVAVPQRRTITVLEADGAPVSGASLTWQAGESFTMADGGVFSLYTSGYTPLDGSPVTVPVPAQEGGVGFQVTFDDGSQYSSGPIDVTGLTELTVTLPPRITYEVTGSVRDAIAMQGTVYLACGATTGNGALQSDGSFHVVAVGFAVPSCSFQAFLQQGDTSRAEYNFYRSVSFDPPVDGAAAATVRLALPDPIDVYAVTPQGAPATLSGNINSGAQDVTMPDGAVAGVGATYYGIELSGGPVSLRLIPSANAYYYLTDGALYSSYGPFSLAGASSATFVASDPGRWYLGTPTASEDGDGVPDAIEGGAPNGGDGNGDGIADAEQPEVTSVPAADGSYLTLDSGSGTTFGPVSTQDGNALPPPPAGVTLPSGLVSFRVDGLAPGGTASVRVYAGSLAGVTGWAKFHDGAWLTLPAADVSVHPAYIDIRITDGGPFDDDGTANGSVLDPGGPAIIADQVPPIVACASAPSGWSASNVTIACTAQDAGSGLADNADASFGLTTSVPDGTETDAATTASRQVCDAAGNCATAGPITGIKVDRRGPQIAITSPADGAQITQGATVLAAYACTDAGSGPATCSGDVAAGQPLPTSTPGAKTLTVNATDAAGNTSTRSVSYTVVAANAAPVVAADMGVTGLETIGSQTGLLALTARFSDADNNGPFAASVQWAPGSAFKPATVTGSTVTASITYLSGGSRAVVVKVCDAAGACGTDTVTVRTYVRDRVTAVAQCVVDRGSAVSPRYLARFGYTSSASVPLWIPVVPGLENTFLREPARRGQPTVFLPGRRLGVLDVAFSSGDVSWRLNGTTATVSSRTKRC